MLEIISYQIALLTVLIALIAVARYRETVLVVVSIGVIIVSLLLIAMTKSNGDRVREIVNPEPIDYNLMTVD